MVCLDDYFFVEEDLDLSLPDQGSLLMRVVYDPMIDLLRTRSDRERTFSWNLSQ